MPVPPPTREQIENALAKVVELGSMRQAAIALGMNRTTLNTWLLEIGPRDYGIVRPEKQKPEAKGRRYLDITDGVIYVGSDSHYWPGEPSTAHKAFVKFIKREKNLVAVVMNGDTYDFPNISRFDADWFQTPTIKDELEVVEERLGEIVKASGKAKRYFTRGNHDVRFDRYLAKNAPEMRGVSGMCIEDRNPLWEPCWSLFVNDDIGGAVIKHRFKGGIHAPHNNALWSGRTMVTGHLHSQKVSPITDYNGTRWGVDAGCLCDPLGQQFTYTENNPLNWISGFVRMKWVGGKLLTPELIRVAEPGIVEFRGDYVRVD